MRKTGSVGKPLLLGETGRALNQTDTDTDSVGSA